MEITLWHGGRNLEYNYKELTSHSNGRWEHGVGLYTTTHYDTAQKYAKGGGKTYLITMDLDTEKSVSNIKVSSEKALDFLGTYCKKNKLKEVSTLLHENMKRLNNMDEISIEIVQNLLLNCDAITPSKTKHLAEFMVENGVQYGLAPNFGGRTETVIVIHDKSIIKKVTAIASKNVDSSQYEITLPPFNWKKILNEEEIQKLSQSKKNSL